MKYINKLFIISSFSLVSMNSKVTDGSKIINENKESVKALIKNSKEEFTISKTIKQMNVKPLYLMKQPNLTLHPVVFFSTKSIQILIDILNFFSEDENKLQFADFDKDTLYNTLFLLCLMLVTNKFHSIDPSINELFSNISTLFMQKIYNGSMGGKDDILEKKITELLDKIILNDNYVIMVHNKIINKKILKNPRIYAMFNSLLLQYYECLLIDVLFQFVSMSHKDAIAKLDKIRTQNQSKTVKDNEFVEDEEESEL